MMLCIMTLFYIYMYTGFGDATASSEVDTTRPYATPQDSQESGDTSDVTVYNTRT